MLVPALSAVLLQTEVATTGLTSSQVNMLMIFAGAVTLAVVIQACILVAMALGAAKARKEIVRLTSEIHGKAMPLIQNVTEIVQDATPKIKNTIDSVEEIAVIARRKAVEIDSLSSEMMMRARQDGRRVDGIVNHTLDKVEHLRDTVNHALMAPVRQAAGAIAAIKAGFEKLKESIPENLEKLKENIPSSLQYVTGLMGRDNPASAPVRPASVPPRPPAPQRASAPVAFTTPQVSPASRYSTTPVNTPSQSSAAPSAGSETTVSSGGTLDRPGSAPQTGRRADFSSSREREKLMGEGDEYHA